MHALRSIMVGSALVFGSLSATAAVTEGSTVSGRPYVSGGIGQGEVEQLKQVAGKYSLQLIVSSLSGAYLADMHTRIASAAGEKVLDTQLNAPWLLVDLKPGAYTVSVTHQGGKKQERKINIVSGKRTELVVQFDVPADTAKSPSAASK